MPMVTGIATSQAVDANCIAAARDQRDVIQTQSQKRGVQEELASCRSIVASRFMRLRPLEGLIKNFRGLMASLKRCLTRNFGHGVSYHYLGCNFVVSRVAARFFPVMAAGVAGPSLFVERDGNAGVGRHVSDGLVQFFKADIERLASGTLGLLKVSDAVNIESFGSRLVQNFGRRFRIFSADFQFDSAEEIGDEPIHADHVVVDEIGLYPGRLQAALCEGALRADRETAAV